MKKINKNAQNTIKNIMKKIKTKKRKEIDCIMLIIKKNGKNTMLYSQNIKSLFFLNFQN